ncbi:hypothetical protein B0E45_26175 [Sinorhizobium sp. A49]|uniref:hypothetical protein n=1 Tax=Sinorhizobium sp. A49 TaxID=1945861 RepID=UPI000986E3A3|nr:hypothetical protein [Sinorhizobium sp. A49]OOG66728.1 hypothetical protein B0E45_26175 [Sinorhizobium sp. A49]
MARKKITVPRLATENTAPAENYPGAPYVNPWPEPAGVKLEKPISASATDDPSLPAYRVQVWMVIDDQYYTQSEVADLFRCSIKTLERWRLAGIGPTVSRFHEGARPLYLGAHLREAMKAAIEPRPGEKVGSSAFDRARLSSRGFRA